MYGGGLLGGLTPGSVLTGFQFRRDGGFGSTPNADTTYTSFDVTLSQSANAPGALSTTFASNIGGGAVAVRTGSLTFPTDSFPGGAGPNGFGPLITFATPYTYTGGDLLVTIRHTGAVSAIGTQGRFLDAEADAGLQYLRATGFTAATATVNQGLAPVVNFQFTPVAAVPAPPAAALALMGLATAGGLARLRRRPAA